MLSRLDPRPGETILDLAAGSGIAGLAAAATAGRVIVSDFSPAMVEAAHRHARELGLHNVDCRVLDAERLDLPDGSVDGVVCRWGYMLMGDPAAALAETRRVLRPSGRLACAVFAGAEENPWAGLPSRVLVEHGHMPPPEAGAPGILALADRDRLRALITGAGFADPEIEDVAFTWRFADGDEYWDFLAQAAGAIAMVLERLADDERAAVRRELDERVAPYRDGGGLEFPAVSLVASA
jgi:SAM-dependent methyltransferase